MDISNDIAQLKQNPRTWLVTGGAGFIGSSLAAGLVALGQKVIVLDDFSSGFQHNLPDGIQLIHGDIRNADLCAKACKDVDVVLNQAAIGSVMKSIEDPVFVDSVNVGGSLTLLTAARNAGVKRFVYASSSAVYGDAGHEVCREDQTLFPKSPYAVTKRAFEMYAHAIGAENGICTTGLRYFNVYGPKQDPKGAYAAVIPRWIDAVLSGRQIEIYGDGKTVRDFCYIDDVVNANIQAALAPAESVSGNAYNIASGTPTTLKDLLHFIEVACGAKAKGPVYHDFRTGDIRVSCASIEKAAKDFGFRPQTGLAHGLRKTADWYAAKG